MADPYPPPSAIDPAYRNSAQLLAAFTGRAPAPLTRHAISDRAGDSASAARAGDHANTGDRTAAARSQNASLLAFAGAFSTKIVRRALSSGGADADLDTSGAGAGAGTGASPGRPKGGSRSKVDRRSEVDGRSEVDRRSEVDGKSKVESRSEINGRPEADGRSEIEGAGDGVPPPPAHTSLRGCSHPSRVSDSRPVATASGGAAAAPEHPGRVVPCNPVQAAPVARRRRILPAFFNKPKPEPESKPKPKPRRKASTKAPRKAKAKAKSKANAQPKAATIRRKRKDPPPPAKDDGNVIRPRHGRSRIRRSNARPTRPAASPNPDMLDSDESYSPETAKRQRRIAAATASGAYARTRHPPSAEKRCDGSGEEGDISTNDSNRIRDAISDLQSLLELARDTGKPELVAKYQADIQALQRNDNGSAFTSAEQQSSSYNADVSQSFDSPGTRCRCSVPSCFHHLMLACMCRFRRRWASHRRSVAWCGCLWKLSRDAWSHLTYGGASRAALQPWQCFYASPASYSAAAVDTSNTPWKWGRGQRSSFSTAAIQR